MGGLTDYESGTAVSSVREFLLSSDRSDYRVNCRFALLPLVGSPRLQTNRHRFLYLPVARFHLESQSSQSKVYTSILEQRDLPSIDPFHNDNGLNSRMD